MTAIPSTQYAVQLIGPSQLKLNPSKEVFRPNAHQILAKIECVGLCFSDLKLLKQFSDHVRKTPIVKGIDPKVLDEFPSYAPNEQPTVPGHEVVVRIVEVGAEVKRHKVGERCLVQTDYRALRTAAGSNAAFGYNIEGALQEYVLMDERIVIDPETNERFLIPVGEELSSSAICLVEPWACVEDSYVTHERQTIKAGGKLLVVADAGRTIKGIKNSFSPDGPPASITAICADAAQSHELKGLSAELIETSDLAALTNESFDDIVYFGVNKATIEILNDKLAGLGIINIVTAGTKIGALVSVGVGRVHYGMTRWIGTTGDCACASYNVIPKTGEIRANDTVQIVGAGGPMGQMHVIRNLCTGLPDVTVVATDMDDSRLESLAHKCNDLAKKNKTAFETVNVQKNPLTRKFSYIALMAPVGPLVAAAIRDSGKNAIINIFAGIPVTVKQEIDLDLYIENSCFMFGTSGSTIEDMKIVLGKVEGHTLDTNVSVDAISGMAGASDGIAAVENRTLAGKIIVYPALRNVGLIPLSKLAQTFPTVAAKLSASGQWTKEAEAELLNAAR